MVAYPDTENGMASFHQAGYPSTQPQIWEEVWTTTHQSLRDTSPPVSPTSCPDKENSECRCTQVQGQDGGHALHSGRPSGPRKSGKCSDLNREFRMGNHLERERAFLGEIQPRLRHVSDRGRPAQESDILQGSEGDPQHGDKFECGLVTSEGGISGSRGVDPGPHASRHSPDITGWSGVHTSSLGGAQYSWSYGTRSDCLGRNQRRDLRRPTRDGLVELPHRPVRQSEN